MENTAEIRLIQIVSPKKYVQDMLLVSLLLIFFYRETSIPLPYVAILSVLLITVSATWLFCRVPFSPPLAMALSLLFFSLVPLLGGSFVFYFILSAVSIWRLHSRYATVQYEGSYDWPFIGILPGFYFPLAGVCVIGGQKTELSLLTVLTAIAVIVSVAGRLVEQWLKANREQNILIDSAKVFTILTIVGTVCFFTIRYFGGYIRSGIEWLLVKTLGLVLPIIGSWLENPVDWIRGIIASRRPEETVKMDPAVFEEPTPTEKFIGLQSDFPWLPILIGAAAIVLLFVIAHMWRNRPDFEKAEQGTFQVNRHTMNHLEEEKNENWLYTMDTHMVREAFIQFEKDAFRFNQGRLQEETVREWFRRMEWNIEPRFFNIYDSVRYGGKTIPEKDGHWFIDQLNKININFFENNV